MLCSCCTDTYAPIRQHVPQHLWSLLPNGFLDAALFQNHNDERQFMAQTKDNFSTSFVNPGIRQKFSYSPVTSTVKKIRESVPAAIFLMMLDCGLVDQLEGRRCLDSQEETFLEMLRDRDSSEWRFMIECSCSFRWISSIALFTCLVCFCIWRSSSG